MRLRSVALLGVDVRVGIGLTITVAATASRQITDPGGVLAVDSGQVTDRLAPLPVAALHGIGPYPAAVLRGYGVDRVGLLAGLESATVQRILGGRAGRLTRRPRPRPPPRRPARPAHLHERSVTFPRDILDGAAVRAALLDLVVQLGQMLRRRGQVARALGLTRKFVGGPSWEKSRRLTEASGHEDDLRTMAYRLIDAAGLQRGRLTGLSLRGEDLAGADHVAQQIRFDHAREDRLVATLLRVS
ncbi:DinB/UmuC family translesion DNA polymerase [Streptomyces sp. B21-083]|uniref:DinB/UmuC family translesion DNA polymerase n=1 Tax=Streptomyces sp. B21-083 TaxID=3039410 RepID=UPI002FEF8679